MSKSAVHLLFFVIQIVCILGFSNVALSAKTTPLNIAYVEGGTYPFYNSTLLSLIRELEVRGLIADGQVPEHLYGNAKAIWDWLAQNAGGDRIRFLPDGFYSAAWSPKKRLEDKKALLDRINTQKDVGLILAFGTAAAQNFATDEHSVPTFCLSVTDPVQSEVSLSVSDSGRNHVYAQLEPDHEHRQLTLFHNAFQFRKLGIAYFDTPEGRAFAGLTRIEKAAAQIGFQLVRCPMPARVSPEADFEQLALCMRTLSKSADAVYLTYNTANRNDLMHQLLQPLITNRIPSFSQLGHEEVRLGVLMSLSQRSHDHAGFAAARAIEQVLNGVSPRSIPQVLNPPLGLAINIRMAMLVGWEPSLEALAAVDEVFESIGDVDD